MTHPPPQTPLQADRTANKAALAQRLITGLAGEYARWTESIAQMAATECNLVGDVLLSSSFVTYAGAFNAELRHELAEVGITGLRRGGEMAGHRGRRDWVGAAGDGRQRRRMAGWGACCTCVAAP